MMDACVSVQTVLSLEWLAAVFTRISRSFNVGLHMFLHVIFEVIAISTYTADKTSINLILNERFYLIFQSV